MTQIYSIFYALYFVEVTGDGLFMPPKELWEANSNRTVRPSVPLSCPVHISYVL